MYPKVHSQLWWRVHHCAAFYFILLQAVNLGKKEERGNVISYLQNFHSPWRKSELEKMAEEDHKEVKEAKETTEFLLDPYNLLVGGMTLDIRKKKDATKNGHEQHSGEDS